MIRAWLIIVGAGLGAAALAWLIGVTLLRLLRRRETHIAERRQHVQRSFSVASAITAMYYTLPITNLPEKQLALLRHLLLILLIVTIAWFVIRMAYVIEQSLIERYPVEKLPENVRARLLRTQIQIIRRIIATLVVLLAIVFVLITFTSVRVAATSVLASAGLASIILGIAAQGTLGHVFAGIQIAFTGALRVDDVVVLEGEWGHIENVQLTHVIVRSWDERRLILPTTYFTTKPYQNWTRYETRVLGTVELQLSFNANIDELRAELARLIETSEHWDRQYWVLEMTDTTAQGVTVRVTASAPNGPKVWWLRVQLREALIKYVREQHPDWLPGRS